MDFKQNLYQGVSLNFISPEVKNLFSCIGLFKRERILSTCYFAHQMSTTDRNGSIPNQEPGISAGFPL